MSPTADHTKRQGPIHYRAAVLVQDQPVLGQIRGDEQQAEVT